MSHPRPHKWTPMIPVVRGVIVFGALAYVLVNLAADLAQFWLTPRLREELA